MNIDEVKEMFACVADSLIEKEPELTEIDRKIGDGDHGIGMKRGFLAVKRCIAGMEASSVNELFKEVGMVLLDAMGGASGVIFGTMFISGFGAAPQSETLTLHLLAQMMKSSLDKIKQRGGCKLGDKTMIDSYEPAVDALIAAEKRDASLAEALQLASEAAAAGAEKTKTYQAKAGRAESYGSFSVGIPDPGAVSVCVIFSAMSDYAAKHQKEGTR